MNFLKSIWTALVGEVRTVEGILANFHTTIANLEAHAQAEVRKVSHLDTVIQDAHAAQAVAASEVAKATAAANAIKAIVSPVVTSVEQTASAVVNAAEQAPSVKTAVAAVTPTPSA